MVLALQSSLELKQYGANAYLGGILGESMVRELSPVLTGLGVAGRSGSAIAAELGAMRATEQIDALQAFGTDPVRKLVVPRLIAAVLMVPVVSILLDVVGLLGGMLVAHGAGLGPDLFFRSMWRSFALDGVAFGFLPKDFIYGAVKPVFFGAIIALTGAYYGLNLEGGSEGVGLATTRAVVTSSVLIFAFDYFLTQILLVVMGV
jgi:phospholipid/cholesterol/gamma-HCH transport system permease protein